MSDWTGSFDDDRAAKRAAWSRLTADQLLAWLDDGLDALHSLGLLDRDRALRRRRAHRWNEQDRSEAHDTSA